MASITPDGRPVRPARRGSRAETAPILTARDKNSFLLQSIAVAAVLVLALFGPNMSVKSSGASGDGSALRQIFYILTFMIALAGTRFWERPGRLLVVPLLLVITLAWCWLSVGWAIEPSASIRRLTLTSMLIWTIFLAVDGAGYERTLMLLRAVLVTVLVVNFAAVILMPQVGIHQADSVVDPGLIGAWRGVLLQKNFAGAATAMTIMAFAFDGRGVSRKTRLAVIALSILFMIGTKSKTSMGLCAVALGAGWLFSRYNPAYRALLIPAAMVAVVAIVMTLDHVAADINAKVMNDPAAFTGRSAIWAPLLRYAGDNLMTGAGFGSFWNIGAAREPIHAYATGWVTVQTSGHNGFLDVLVQVGLPGLILCVLAYIVAPLARLLSARNVPPASGGLLMAVLIFCAGHNVTESSLIERDLAVHVFLLFAIAMIRVVTRGPRRVPAPHRAWRVRIMNGVFR